MPKRRSLASGEGSVPPILIIQRDEEARGLLIRILENEGLEALGAGGVGDAISVLRVARPALLVVDAGDELHDAADLVSALEGACPGEVPPAIALCRSVCEEERARRAGARVGIRKPFSVDAFLSAVRANRPAARAL